MISFTDDDLKRLKESLNGELPEFSTWAKSDLKVLKSLLARLEAAENYIAHSHGPASPFCCEKEIALDKEWRKAAGKK